jgi:tRNA(Ile)-lysidine synthase
MSASQKDYGSNKISKTVERTLLDFDMVRPGDSILVGLSGGPDSVALLHVLYELRAKFSIGRLGVCHLNHGLRRKDSDRDAEFAASLAKELDLPFYTKKEDVLGYRQAHRLSLEEAGRCVRYAFYEKVAHENGFSKIALGHHSDDNAELVLMNLLRGSGSLGFSGIPAARDQKIIRPLIRLMRTEILHYLTARKLKYRIDSSNDDKKYLRNRIRGELIPILKTNYNPGIIETVNRFAAIIKDEDQWLEAEITTLFDKIAAFPESEEVSLSLPELAGIHIAVKRRIIRKAISIVKGNLRRITFAQIDSAIRLMEKGPPYGVLDLPDRIRITRNRHLFIIKKENKPLRQVESRLPGERDLFFEYEMIDPGLSSQSVFIEEIGRRLRVSRASINENSDTHPAGHPVAFFDMDSLVFPLIIRNVRPGDRFTPLGMSGTQKVKKFFINNKVPKAQRWGCPLLLSKEKIIWVVGYRIDDSVRIKPLTRNVLKVELLLA